MHAEHENHISVTNRVFQRGQCQVGCIELAWYALDFLIRYEAKPWLPKAQPRRSSKPKSSGSSVDAGPSEALVCDQGTRRPC